MEPKVFVSFHISGKYDFSDFGSEILFERPTAEGIDKIQDYLNRKYEEMTITILNIIKLEG